MRIGEGLLEDARVYEVLEDRRRAVERERRLESQSRRARHAAATAATVTPARRRLCTLRAKLRGFPSTTSRRTRHVARSRRGAFVGTPNLQERREMVSASGR